MKKQKRVVLIFLLCLFTLSSCKDKVVYPDIVDEFILFKLINNSGVEVAIVNNVKLFPDSLVLENGDVYEWAVSSPNKYIPMSVSTPPKIYFDKKIYIVYDENYMPERDPSYGQNYDKMVIDEYETYSYTFTTEDYQNALKQQ